LIESVFAAFRGRWDATRATLLNGSSIPLADRLFAFYAAYIQRHGDYPAARLFMHAALAGINFPLRYTADLDALVLRPVLTALREEAGLLPPPKSIPKAERELVIVPRRASSRVIGYVS